MNILGLYPLAKNGDLYNIKGKKLSISIPKLLTVLCLVFFFKKKITWLYQFLHQ